MKKHKVKDKFLEVLEQQPIIQAACKQVGISRNTYYRWRNEDTEFSSLVDDRMSIGIDLVNDYAESNILNGIKRGDLGSTKYWLNNKHKDYKKTFHRHHHKDAQEEVISKQELEEKKQRMKEWQERWK